MQRAKLHIVRRYIFRRRGEVRQGKIQPSGAQIPFQLCGGLLQYINFNVGIKAMESGEYGRKKVGGHIGGDADGDPALFQVVDITDFQLEVVVDPQDLPGDLAVSFSGVSESQSLLVR